MNFGHSECQMQLLQAFAFFWYILSRSFVFRIERNYVACHLRRTSRRLYLVSDRFDPDQARCLSNLIWVKAVCKNYQQMTHGEKELSIEYIIYREWHLPRQLTWRNRKKRLADRNTHETHFPTLWPKFEYFYSTYSSQWINLALILILHVFRITSIQTRNYSTSTTIKNMLHENTILYSTVYSVCTEYYHIYKLILWV